MGDDHDQSETIELTCTECDSTWRTDARSDSATCPECGSDAPMEEHGP